MRAIRILVVVLAVLAVSAPAMAASSSGRIGLSWDGTTWASQLSGALFDRPGTTARWVPGDSDTRHFYVRDTSGSDARLAIDYALPPNDLVDASDFVLTATVDGADAVRLTPGSGWLDLGGTTLANGHAADIAVTATFRWDSPDRSQAERFPLAFRVTLSEIAGPEPDTAGGKDGDDGGSTSGHRPGHGHGLGDLLPATGAPEIRWALGLGLLCLGGGVGVVVLSRRRDRDAETS